MVIILQRLSENATHFSVIAMVNLINKFEAVASIQNDKSPRTGRSLENIAVVSNSIRYRSQQFNISRPAFTHLQNSTDLTPEAYRPCVASGIINWILEHQQVNSNFLKKIIFSNAAFST